MRVEQPVGGGDARIQRVRKRAPRNRTSATPTTALGSRRGRRGLTWSISCTSHPVVAHLAVYGTLVFGLALAAVSIPIQIAEMTRKEPVDESRFELIPQFAAATR